VIAEAGADLSAFPSEKQFASWLGLCPTNEQSGGKILNRRTRKVVNRATVAFRNAASTLLRSQSYLGAQYRRLRTRLGAPKAITAMASKAGLPFLQAHQTPTAECRPRNRILRSQVSPAADPIAGQTGAKAWTSTGFS
jgi:transposase